VNIQEHLVRNPLVLFHDLQKVQTSPSTAYLKGNILFVDGSTLSILRIPLLDFRRSAISYVLKAFIAQSVVVY
jgi:prepilin-type processing-associated H-X9-DG protein